MTVLDHRHVKLLDGGSAAWITGGNPLVTVGEAAAPVDPGKAPPKPPPFIGGRRLEFLATRFDVAAAIDDPASVILDVRRRS